MSGYMLVDYDNAEWISYSEKGRYLPPLVTENMVMTVLEFKPGYSPPLHTHIDEQITYVRSGVLEIDIQDGNMVCYEILTAGMAITIASYIPHRLIGIEEGSAVEVWSPGRRFRASTRNFRLGAAGKPADGDGMSTGANGDGEAGTLTLADEGAGHNIEK